MARREDQVIGENGVEIHGDILEVILSHVPLIDLVPASHVSKSWCYSVASSLRHNKPKPWLILHTQATSFPYATLTHAYDPRSCMWIKISQPSIKYNSTLKSSHSKFLYTLSSTKLSFSLDPLNLTWSHVDPPLVWRADPIVARVGDLIIVAGGGCDYGDDPLPVEIYNIVTRAWHTCDTTMPGNLKDSAASSGISITTTNEKLFVAEKQSGLAYWFDPNTRCWSGPNKLNPNQPIYDHNIGTSNDDLILVGLCKNIENVEQVKIWKVEKENFQCEEIGEMPLLYVEKLKSENFGISSINIRVTGNFVYMYNQSEMEEVVVCELITGGGCRWWSIQNVVARDETIMNRLVFTCSEVSFDELQRVTRLENRRFVVES